MSERKHMFFRREAQPESSMEEISSAEERKDNILYEKENRVSQSAMLNRYSTTSKDQEESSHEDDKKEKTYSSVELDEMPKRYYEYFSTSELESSSTGGSGVEQEESEYEDTEGEGAEGEDTEGEDSQSVFTHSNISAEPRCSDESQESIMTQFMKQTTLNQLKREQEMKKREWDKIQHSNLDFFDTIILYNEQEKARAYLSMKIQNNKYEWVEDKEAATNFVITPIFNDTSNIIKNNYECFVDDRKYRELTFKSYLGNLKKLHDNLDRIRAAQKFHLPINHAFILKRKNKEKSRQKTKLKNLPIIGEENCADVEQWQWVRMGENTQGDSPQPRKPYYLATLTKDNMGARQKREFDHLTAFIHELHYLGSNPEEGVPEASLWSDKVIKYCDIRCEIREKSKISTDTDIAQQQLTSTDSWMIFDSQNRYINCAREFPNIFKLNRSKKHPIVTTEYQGMDYEDISQINSFEIKYYPNESRVLFKTKCKLHHLSHNAEERANRPFEGFKEKYIAYDEENDHIFLSPELYYFRVEPEGDNLLRANLKFKLGIDGTSLYVSSTPSSTSAVSKIEVTEIDERTESNFKFHLAKVPKLGSDLGGIENELSRVKRDWDKKTTVLDRLSKNKLK